MKHSDEDLDALLSSSDPRPPIPGEDLAAIRGAARQVWERKYARRRRVWLLPMAAAVAGIAVLALWAVRRPTRLPPLPGPVSVARVEVVRGTDSLAAGQDLPAGSMLQTAEGSRVSLRLSSGPSLRLDGGTVAVLSSPALVELRRGALYVDSQTGSEVVIRTSAGDFLPAGTQFEVRVDAAGTQLRVREGRVVLNRGSGSVTASAGESLVVHAGGEVQRTAVRSDDPGWSWVSEAAPMPAIEGKTLRFVVDWIAREKGWKLEFADIESALLSEKIIVHGSIEQMSAEDALRTVLLSSGYTHQLTDGKLLVRSTN